MTNSKFIHLQGLVQISIVWKKQNTFKNVVLKCTKIKDFLPLYMKSTTKSLKSTPLLVCLKLPRFFFKTLGRKAR